MVTTRQFSTVLRPACSTTLGLLISCIALCTLSIWNEAGFKLRGATQQRWKIRKSRKDIYLPPGVVSGEYPHTCYQILERVLKQGMVRFYMFLYKTGFRPMRI